MELRPTAYLCLLEISDPDHVWEEPAQVSSTSFIFSRLQEQTMSSCCGACGGQDTEPKKDQKQEQPKDESKQGLSKELPKEQEQKQEK